MPRSWRWCAGRRDACGLGGFRVGPGIAVRSLANGRLSVRHELMFANPRAELPLAERFGKPACRAGSAESLRRDPRRPRFNREVARNNRNRKVLCAVRRSVRESPGRKILRCPQREWGATKPSDFGYFSPSGSLPPPKRGREGCFADPQSAQVALVYPRLLGFSARSPDPAALPPLFGVRRYYVFHS